MTEQAPGILIVDDSPLEAELLRRTLRDAGYATSVAKNGVEALEKAQVRPPALVLSDINMPEMDGYQLCRAIKYDDVLWDVPVILLTVLSEPKDIIEAIGAGADAYFVKPFVAASLIDRIHTLLDMPSKRRRADERRVENVDYGGERLSIAGGGQQILNMLLSLYENMLSQNRELTATQARLAEANETLDLKVRDRTAALTASEARYHHLFENMGSGVAIYQPDAAVRARAFWHRFARLMAQLNP